MKRYIEIEAARDIMLQTPFTPGIEKVSLEKSPGRILAEDILSPMDLPPFNRSPLDGYALNHEETNGASPDVPVVLKVPGIAPAGTPYDKILGPGEAVRIMTGGAVPLGADCVIAQEATDRGNKEVQIRKQMIRHENICFRGEEVAWGERILKKGTFITHVEIGALAGLGISLIPVYKKLKAGILCTGSEIVQPGKSLGSGKIYNSNGLALAARLEEFGVESRILEDVADKKGPIKRSIRKNISPLDILITTGGVSVGDTDYLEEVIDDLGGDIKFSSVAVKPGSSMVFGLLGNKPVVCLSGNPSAAMVGFEILARPLIAKMTRDRRLDISGFSGILVSSFDKKSPVRRMIRARIRSSAERTELEIVRNKQSSGMISASLGSNCLIDIPAGTGVLKPGLEVSFIPLDTGNPWIRAEKYIEDNDYLIRFRESYNSNL